MAESVTKIIVKNLPNSDWTKDYLVNFLETETSLELADEGAITQFVDIKHSALVHLSSQVAVSQIEQAQAAVSERKFDGNVLTLIPIVSSTTCSLLVRYDSPSVNRDVLFYYFDNGKRSGSGDVELQDFVVISSLRMAILTYKGPDAVRGVLAKGNHAVGSEEARLSVEEWHEEFHRPLLNDLLARPASVKLPDPLSQHPAPETDPLLKQAFCSGRPRPPPITPKPKGHPKTVSGLPVQLEVPMSPQQLSVSEQSSVVIPTNPREQACAANIQKATSSKLDVPCYQMKLLKDFKSSYNVEMMDDGVHFYGSAVECQNAKREFLLKLQNLAEDWWTIPDIVSRVLESAKGSRYLEDLLQRFPRCSVALQGTKVQCAAQSEPDLQEFKTLFQDTFFTQTCLVPPSVSMTPGFRDLQTKLEATYVLSLSLPGDPESEEVQVSGMKDDVELAARQVAEYTQKNRSQKNTFRIKGKVASQACKKWFSRELMDTKMFIQKNGEIEDEDQSEDGYSLRFTCRQEVIQEVMDKLKLLQDKIVVQKINLYDRFSNYSDRALVVNGLHAMKVERFSTQLKHKMDEKDLQCLIDIVLPEPHTLPQLRQKDQGRKQSVKKDRHRGGHHKTSYRSSAPVAPLPSSVQMGGTAITVKLGDITCEQVDAAVNIVDKELSLKSTAISSAFRRQCPDLEELLKSSNQGQKETGRCRFLTTNNVGDLPMSQLYHAILYKLPHKKVAKVVKDLVTQILQQAVQSGMTSVAFPPLGVGRRFGYGRQTTATAMFQAFLQFPGSFQSLSIVASDNDVAGVFAGILQKDFAQAMQSAPQRVALDHSSIFFGLKMAKAAVAQQKLAKMMMPVAQLRRRVPAPVPQQLTGAQTGGSSDEDVAKSTSESSDSDSGIDPQSCYQEEVKEDSPRGDFMAVLCVRRAADTEDAVDVLIKELKMTFLWQETLSEADADTFWHLDREVLQEFLKEATRTNVLFSIIDNRIKVCGKKDSVKELLSHIHSKMLVVLRQPSAGPRDRLGLPTDTYRLPCYWNICRKDIGKTVTMEKARERWEKRGKPKLESVSQQELQVVTKLVDDTWDAAKAGLGADARSLAHTGIQVLKVERLENPELWTKYSQQREFLFDRLAQKGYPAVEKLPGSSGPVNTTANILAKGPLDREIYHHVNEHYLFHGTKAESLHKIYAQGLDFRVGSNVMLGRGVYTCESSTKADQYTDPKQQRSSGQQLTMILARVILGHPFVNKQQRPEQYARPPCQKCSMGVQCQCVTPVLFDSVIDDVRLFREFVLYDLHVVYPEYFITYNRVNGTIQQL